MVTEANVFLECLVFIADFTPKDSLNPYYVGRPLKKKWMACQVLSVDIRLY